MPGVGALRDPPRIHFMDNLDPDSYGALLARLPLKTSRFVAVSKSGGTGETLMQTIAALDAVKAAKLDAARACSSASPSRPSPARPTACAICSRPIGIAMLDHDTGVGGRFSVLTNVGLLPAAVCGLDIGAIRQGAADALAPVLGRQAAGRGAGRGRRGARGRARRRARPIAVMMAYADRLERFTRWYVQLWAESLGKDGKGTTPIGALGPVDQHSQLQLYIAGPRDKLFTIVTVGAGRPRPAHRRRSRQARRRAGFRRQDHRRSGRGAGPRHRRDAGQERLPGAHHPSSTRSTSGTSANC